MVLVIIAVAYAAFPYFIYYGRFSRGLVDLAMGMVKGVVSCEFLRSERAGWQACVGGW